MSEKKTPEYVLEDIKKAFSRADRLRMTVSAKQGQVSLGFTDDDVVGAIQALTNRDFYKSMAPRHPGFTAWQDVYKSRFKGVELYIKFQVGTRGELILSFKEK
ncbi:TPA: type II toxin-antitoxin system MqsR family toxin [Legionella pneumophila]|uniref:Type II toxin-antitoxin system MqsR family toxin n=1 Tax=Legionella pneumophila TaxID=446 RepID=A0AAN5R686_LEGPN|nr:type II toxin-antitoxin system MqsR family toxin [Legionella israelensis]QDP73739.1 type II toxin-antitoxin system MqsR family toxin [Legionella israelensis]HAT1597535.1 type II toxin-antitoxin system MqsR family toxin [Legionella pneumophila]